MKYVLVFLLIIHFTNLSPQTFYLGADLSYINEIEDCGAVFHENMIPKDPYLIFRDHQANTARFRIWHTPEWTNYSNLNDVIKSIARAKSKGFSILLDFHYSDTWADPANQIIPSAWKDINDLNILGDSVYNYTLNTLNHLHSLGLLPEMVQIGNEINGNILLKQGEPLYPINWGRNIDLLNRGIDAVKTVNQSFGTDVKTVIHIAQPENAVWWFEEARNYGFTGFDFIGISYYPGWSNHGMREAATMVGQLKQEFGKDVLVVETGYPWTLENADNANNILGNSNLLNTYNSTASIENQRDFLIEFSYLVKENGGSGVIYWEPAWVSTQCSTPWGIGSFYDNATFFDFDYNLHQGISFLEYDYNLKPPSLDSVMVKFIVDVTGVDTTHGIFVTGDFTGSAWQFKRMNHIGNHIFKHIQKIPGRSSGAYIFQNKNDWNLQSRETVPAECALKWNTHREFVTVNQEIEFAYVWGTCNKISGLLVDESPASDVQLFPNPGNTNVTISTTNRISQVDITDHLGNQIFQSAFPDLNSVTIDISAFQAGIYLFIVYTGKNSFTTYKVSKY